MFSLQIFVEASIFSYLPPREKLFTVRPGQRCSYNGSIIENNNNKYDKLRLSCVKLSSSSRLSQPICWDGAGTELCKTHSFSARIFQEILEHKNKSAIYREGSISRGKTLWGIKTIDIRQKKRLKNKERQRLKSK